jgi:hypothetical protein
LLLFSYGLICASSKIQYTINVLSNSGHNSAQKQLFFMKLAPVFFPYFTYILMRFENLAKNIGKDPLFFYPYRSTFDSKYGSLRLPNF